MSDVSFKKPAFVLILAVKGIQKYIFSTGKLREMIGGSEIITLIGSSDFYKPLLEKKLGMREDEKLQCQPGSYIVAQANAGTLCLILPDGEQAKNFMRLASQQLLTDFPGLPFYGAIESFTWSDDKAGREAYDEARKRAEDVIAQQRAEADVPVGAPMLPMLQPSRLDGLSAVKIEKIAGGPRRGTPLSLPSSARSSRWTLDQSRQRLRNYVKPPEGVEFDWQDDLEKMLGGENKKVALICMDGNDLGKLFGSVLQDSENQTLSQCLKKRKELSQKIQDCNTRAFA